MERVVSAAPPPPHSSSQFTKEEEEEEEDNRGNYGEVSVAIKFFAGRNVDEGGKGPIEGMVGGWGVGVGGKYPILVAAYMVTWTIVNRTTCRPTGMVMTPPRLKLKRLNNHNTAPESLSCGTRKEREVGTMWGRRNIDRDIS